MRPAQALDKQASLAAALTQPAFRNWIHAFITRFSDDDSHQLTAEYERKFSDEVNKWITDLATDLKAVPTYYVSPEMVDVTKQASELLDPDVDLFDGSLAPTPDGIVVLDGNHFMMSAQDNGAWFEVPVRAIIWCPATVQFGDTKVPGKALWFFGELNAPEWLERNKDVTEWRMKTGDAVQSPDLVQKYITQIHPTWVFYKFEIKLTARTLDAALRSEQLVVPQAGEATPTQLMDRTKLDPDASFIHALWVLLNQTITVTERDIPDRMTLKRMRRMNLPEFVTVIRLRHKIYPTSTDNEDNPASVEWQRRWLVRGHWMWARACERTPGAVELSPGRWRVRVWRGEHIKGPEDKPLVLTRKVNALIE